MSSSDALQRLVAITTELREVHPEMQVQAIAVFSLVALRPGLTPTEISTYLGITLESSSRNLRALSDRVFKGKPGLGLVDMRQNMVDFRSKNAHLSAAGARLSHKLVKVLERGEHGSQKARGHVDGGREDSLGSVPRVVQGPVASDQA